jgi:hypothetical protein
MQGAETVLFIGSRGVCQADCSGVGYPNATAVVNINGDLHVMHYANTAALPGDISAVIARLLEALPPAGGGAMRAPMAPACAAKKPSGQPSSAARTGQAPLFDPVWQREVLTSPPPSARGAVCQRASGRSASSTPATCRPTASRSSRTATWARPSPRPAPPTWALPSRHCWARPGSRPALWRGLHRRRQLHDEPAGADRCGGTWRARHDRAVRQPQDGRHHRAAVCAVRRRVRHQRQRCGGLCRDCGGGAGREGDLGRDHAGRA